MPARADATIYSCKDEATATQVRALIKMKKTSKEILDSLNKNSQLNVTIEHKMFVKGENKLVDGHWKKGAGKNVMADGRVKFVMVDHTEKKRLKTLQEARGAVTTDYQNQLDQEWIAQLKAKYPVTVNHDVLKMVK